MQSSLVAQKEICWTPKAEVPMEEDEWQQFNLVCISAHNSLWFFLIQKFNIKLEQKKTISEKQDGMGWDFWY